jgi:hypothetical protein
MLKRVFAALMVMAFLVPWVNGAALAFTGCNGKVCMLKAKNCAHGKSCRITHNKAHGNNAHGNHHEGRDNHNGHEKKRCHEEARLECEKDRGNSTSVENFKEDPFLLTSATIPAFGAMRLLALTEPPCYSGPCLLLLEKPPNASLA